MVIIDLYFRPLRGVEDGLWELGFRYGEGLTGSSAPLCRNTAQAIMVAGEEEGSGR
jgi:hypothetical protein